MTDARRYAPATARNRGPILSVLRRILPATGQLLEVASGPGEHAAAFAPQLPGWTWLPTDHSEAALSSVQAWRSACGAANLLMPARLDATWATWPVDTVDAVFASNLLHIAPWAICVGLIAGSGRVLCDGGLLILYGPFCIGGVHTAPSNASFDKHLRAQDPAWGVRDLDAVTHLAAQHGLAHLEAVPMPANNLTVVFQRARR